VQPGAGGQGGGTQNAATTQVAVSIDVGYQIEKLKQTGAITIEIVRQQEGASVAEMEQNALTLLKETLLNEFFRPAMTDATAALPQVAGAAAGISNQMQAGTADTSRGVTGGGGQVDIGFQLQFKKQEELGQADYDYSVTAPETRTHAPNGFFSALLENTDRGQHIREINLDDPFFKLVDVDITTTADFAALDLKSMVVEMQYGGTIAAPEVTGSYVFTATDADSKHFQAFRNGGGFGYRYRVLYAFGQSPDIAAQAQSYTTEWRSVLTRTLVVHPADDIAMLRVFIEPGVVDWAVVDTIEAHLSYDDPAHGFHAERIYLVQQSSQRQEWTVRLSDPLRTSYQVQYVWHLKDLREIAGDAFTHQGSQLFVVDQFVDRLPITLEALVDPTNVSRVDVELLYEDEHNHLDVRKLVELPGPDFHRVAETIPLVDPDRREFTYRATLIKKNGSVESQAAVTTERLSIAITEGGIYFDVVARVLGSLDAVGIQAIQLDLRSEPLDGARQKEESILFESGGETKVTQRLLLRADRPTRFEYKTTVFLANGDPRESDWTVHENSNLVLQPQRLVAG